MERANDSSSAPPPPEVHDAFAFLLEEIDHEDLARSMRNELARGGAPAAVAAMTATPLDAATPSYHLLATAEATEAAVLAPAELYIESDAFGAAHWLPPSTAIHDDDDVQQQEQEQQYPLPLAYAVSDNDAAVATTDDATDATDAAVAPPTTTSPSTSATGVTSPSASHDAAATATLEIPDTSVTNSTDDEKSSPAPVRKPMENSTRKRQKEELAYLREKVLELESELGAMKNRALASALSRQSDDAASGSGSSEGDDAAVASPSSSSSSSSSALKDSQGQLQAAGAATSQSSETRVAKVSLWERVAKRQLLEKQKAELKNLKLKTALEDQLKIAKSLERVLRKRPAATLSTQALDSVQVVNNKRFCSLSRSDASIYDMLLANTEKVYAEVDNVYARNEFLHLEDDVNDTKLKVDESNQLYMEITHAKIIPFDLQTTIDGVWQVLSLKQVPISGGVYEAVERTRDTICARTTMTLHLRDTETTVRTQFVMKRFDEPDRVILACESTTQSEGPREVVHGIKVLEKGWIVIKPASVKKKDSTPSTLIQLCMRMTPTITGEMLESQRRHTGAITDIMLGWVNKSLGVMYQTVENILMESVAQQQGAAAMAAAMAAAAGAP